MTARKELADRLEAIALDDHERGCEGLNYLCSCGFDDREHDALKEAAAALRQEPSVEQIERFRAWYRGHTGKMITRANAMKAIAALYRGEA